MKTLISFSLLLLSLLLFILMPQGCTDKNESPECMIVSPSNGEKVAQGTIVTISADATDADGNIKEVRYYVDGTGKGSADQFPYEYNWNTNGVSLGAHTIRAVAFDNEGASSSEEIQVEIVQGVGGDIPSAAFTASKTTAEVGEEIQFTDESLNQPTTWFWTFGDGSTSAIQNPKKVYGEPGHYDVTLTVANAYGTDAEAKSDFVMIVGYQGGTFTDPRDGKEYDIVEIGSQTWFAENLNYETSASMVYNNNQANADVYGRLYTLSDAASACPDGWHLPSDGEWANLEKELGLPTNMLYDLGWRGTHGVMLKSDTDWNGNNESGFSALPGGFKRSAGPYEGMGYWAFFWTSSTSGISRGLNEDADVGRLDIMEPSFGLSVRCIKD